jgi:hypothetical protein
MLSDRTHQRPRVVGASTWLASFAIATLFGLCVAVQRWYAYRGPNKPSSFWDASYIQPKLIPWFAWAVIAPLLMLLVHRLPWGELRVWRRAALYAAVGVLAIAAQAIVTGLALGWWWSFPNLIPMDPAWHIAYELRTRTTLSLLIVWLIVAMYHARVRATAAVMPPAVPAPPAPPAPAASPAPTAPPPQAIASIATPAVPQGPLTLRGADRVWFVEPSDIDWIEADGDYVIVHVGTTQHRVREAISSIERRLPQAQLLRVSRSAIVNLSAIREMQRWFRGNFVIILRGGTRVITGAKYRDRLIGRM